MPTRSTGCATCRKRKVRCDEARPGCKRCTTHGVRCPGYRQDEERKNRFMDETQTIIKKANIKYGFDAMTDATNWRTSSASLSPSGDESSASESSNEWTLTLFAPSNPRSLLSPELESQQMYNEFLSIYLPKSAAWNQVDHSSFFNRLAFRRNQNAALRHGINALSMVQIGGLHKNQSLIKRAVASYGQALTAVATQIRRGDYLHDDDVLFAVNMLMTCELYGDIANLGGWLSHVDGFNRLLMARGPDRIQSEDALLMYSNLRHMVIVQSFISRRAPFLATPEWRAVAWRMPKYLQDDSIMFYEITLQIPGLLERFDRLDPEAPDALAEAVALLDESVARDRELGTWGDEYARSAERQGRTMYEMRPIDEFPAFTSLCSDRTFEEAYFFADFYVGYLYSTLWQARFFLRVAIRELQVRRHRSDSTWFPAPEDTITEEDLLGDIVQICRGIPSCCEPSSGAAGSIAMFLPMRTVAGYFVEHGHWRYLKWANAVRNSVFVKGLAPPDVSAVKFVSFFKPAQQQKMPSAAPTIG